ncbi:MAG: hypothetical protein AB2A00_38765 [Myxococcota bacterium]
MTTTNATFTLQSVSALVGTATPEEIELFSVALTSAELVEMGRLISSGKILTDAIRWGGQVAQFCAQATPEQLQQMGFSTAQLRVFWKDVVELDQRNRARRAGAEVVSDQREVDATAAEEKVLQGRAERRALYAMLSNAARDNTAQAAVETAHGTAPDTDGLVASLKQLSALGLQWLSSGAVQGRRLAASRVTAERFTAAAALANEVEAAARKASGAGVSGPVTQAQLDEQDGRVLSHMTALRSLFGATRQDDPNVPLLQPIASSSYFLKPKGGAKKAAGTPEPVDA